MTTQHINSIHAALVAELDHAHAHIERLRRAQQTLIQQLLDQGLPEADALGHVTQWKSYKALRRDENLYLSMWLRLSKRLEKYADTPEITNTETMPPSMPTRDAAPRNAQCPCGSGLKYKRCCLGKPLGQPNPKAA